MLEDFLILDDMNFWPTRILCEIDCSLGRMVQISGWGAQHIDERESPVLREASALLVNASVCLAHDFDMTETDICLSGLNGATTCFTDAGGPVVLDGHLVAILSPKEFHCGQWRSFAAVDLARFKNWMEKHLEPDAKMIV